MRRIRHNDARSSVNLERLSEASDQILRGILRGDRPDALNTSARIIHDLLRAEACAIFVRLEPPDDADLVLEASYSDQHGHGFYPRRRRIEAKPGAGLTGYVAHTGKILRLHGSNLDNHPSNARQIARHLKGGKRFSVLAIPLKNRKDRVLGVLVVHNKKSRRGRPSGNDHFDTQDEAMARTLAGKLIFILESFRTSEIFRNLMQGILTSNHLHATLEGILSAAVLLLRADRGDLAWADPGRNLVLAAVYPRATTLKVNDAYPAHSVVYQLWKHARDFTLVKHVTIIKRKKVPYFECDNRTESELAVLLRVMDRPVGVINCEAFKSNYFDDHDRRLMQQLGSYIAVAAQVVGTVADLNNLFRLVTEAAAPRRTLLIDILRNMQLRVGFDAGIIYIADHANRLLRCESFIGCDELTINPEQFTYRFDDASIATYVLDRRDACYVGSPQTDPRTHKAGLDAFGIQGPLIAMPLIFASNPVACLYAGVGNEASPQDYDVEALRPSARLAAAAIGLSSSERLTRESGLRAVLLAAQAIGFDRVRVFKYVEDEAYFEGTASVGMTDVPAFVGYRVPLSNRYARHIQRTAISDNRARKFPIHRLGPDPDSDGLKKDPAAPWAIAPLVVDNRLFGYLAADNTHTKRSISEDDLAYLTVLASQAAEAIAIHDRAERLHESLKNPHKLLVTEARRGELERKRRIGRFDVFFCYNHRNRKRIARVAGQMEQECILPLWDKRIPPGAVWNKWIFEEIDKCRSAVIFIGAYGLGNFQRKECTALLKRGVRLMPVLLDKSSAYRIPRTLKHIHPIDITTSRKESIAGLVQWIRRKR